jgi:transcription termination factor Rho
VTKAELESKHLAELHALAAKAGVERYRMLPRAELIEQLAEGGNGGGTEKGGEAKAGPRRQRPRRSGDGERGRGEGRERKPRQGREPRPERRPKAEPKEAPAPPEPEPAVPAATPSSAPKRKRRRRRWGRRGRKGVGLHDLLLPPASGQRAIVYGEGREACTAVLRELAAELAGASKGPDPIALLIDPSPEELADWKREAPAAEIVSAGKAAHAEDALAQAARRAAGGEDVIVLIDSLTRFAESFAGPEEARALYAAGLDATGGTLTVVAALERPI